MKGSLVVLLVPPPSGLYVLRKGGSCHCLWRQCEFLFVGHQICTPLRWYKPANILTGFSSMCLLAFFSWTEPHIQLEITVCSGGGGCCCVFQFLPLDDSLQCCCLAVVCTVGECRHAEPASTSLFQKLFFWLLGSSLPGCGRAFPPCLWQEIQLSQASEIQDWWICYFLLVLLELHS